MDDDGADDVNRKEIMTMLLGDLKILFLQLRVKEGICLGLIVLK